MKTKELLLRMNMNYSSLLLIILYYSFYTHLLIIPDYYSLFLDCVSKPCAVVSFAENFLVVVFDDGIQR